jgi:hypothetical protein
VFGLFFCINIYSKLNIYQMGMQIKKILLESLFILLVGISTASSSPEKLSEYRDCSDSYFEETTFDSPLTQEEKTKKLDDAFYGLISDERRCSKSSFSQSSASNGSGSGDPDIKSLSQNLSTIDAGSIGIDSSKSQLPVAVNQSTTSMNGMGVGNNGGVHQVLEEVDNRKALRLQIKKQADIETDPEIKRKLLEQYEALK